MSIMDIKNGFNLFTSLVLSLVNLFVLSVLVWACFHGLDLSDESFYYLGYLYYDNVPSLHPESFHMVYDRFFGWGNFTITSIRLLRLLLSVLASVVLFLSANEVLRLKELTVKIVLLNVVLSGMLLSYSWAPQALSYNSMSSIVIALIMSLWVFFLIRKKLYSKILFSFSLGGLFTILFFIKITNVLLLPLLLIMTLFFTFKKYIVPFSTRMVPISLLAFIFGSFSLLVFFSDGGIGKTVGDYIQGTFGLLSKDTSHSLTYLLERYYTNGITVLKQLKVPFTILIVTYSLIRIFAGKIGFIGGSKGKVLFKTFGLLILVVAIFQNTYWLGGTKFKYTILNTHLIVLVLVGLNRSLENGKKELAITFGLLTIPILGALGTNNGLSAQVLFYGVFIFLSIFLALYFSESNWFRNSTLLILIVITGSQIVFATIKFPYKQRPLKESTHAFTNIPTLKSLKADRALFNLSKEVDSLKDLEMNYIFTYGIHSGLVLFAHKKPYSLEWLNGSVPSKICATIEKSEISPNDVIFLVPTENPFDKRVLECMRQNGIFFEKNYQKAKTVTYYDTYYKKDIELSIYVPND